MLGLSLGNAQGSKNFVNGPMNMILSKVHCGFALGECLF
jgi:hypothetical protein